MSRVARLLLCAAWMAALVGCGQAQSAADKEALARNKKIYEEWLAENGERIAAERAAEEQKRSRQRTRASREADSLSGTETDARVMAWQFLEDNLKFPDNADIHWGTSVEPRRQSGRLPVWEATGKVDAKNAFGAVLTHRFVAHVRHVGGEKWVCHYLRIGDEICIDNPPPETPAAAAPQASANASAAKPSIESPAPRHSTAADVEAATLVLREARRIKRYAEQSVLTHEKSPGPDAASGSLKEFSLAYGQDRREVRRAVESIGYPPLSRLCGNIASALDDMSAAVAVANETHFRRVVALVESETRQLEALIAETQAE